MSADRPASDSSQEPVSRVAAQRSPLTLITPLTSAEEERIAFCSHCAVMTQAHASDARVCASCGLGLILDASAELAPGADSAFLVLDESLSVCAVSCAAEALLEVSETSAVNQHLTAFLWPAENDSREARELALTIMRAARGTASWRELTVRPANTFGVRLTARIGTCGPKPAALIVLE